ncbi:hypothetical protein [Sphingomonas soli]|uniref:hypothetical protein n=1 Tax=Sphingomonas soli TaxID=266127 RepID=UPI000A6033D4|nr:hypothetical protein [Sphingomonas soli]
MALRGPKFKIITKQGKVFLYRLSIPLWRGSLKIHLIVNDDVGDPHIHPWEFSTFLLLGAYKEWVDSAIVRHWPFALVRYGRAKRHKVILYRLFGVKLPCLTVGRYSEKVQPWCQQTQLCDLCAPHGECLDKIYWRERGLANALDKGTEVEPAEPVTVEKV